MRIDIYHHFPEDSGQLARIERKVNALTLLQRTILDTEATLLEKLNTANEVTNEIAVELQQLLDRPDVTIPQSVSDSVDSLVARLQGVAAETPTPPAEPQG